MQTGTAKLFRTAALLTRDSLKADFKSNRNGLRRPLMLADGRLVRPGRTAALWGLVQPERKKNL